MPNADAQVSVIIPAFGVAQWIGECVSSALGQSLAPYEVIVVNDGSPDTPELERALAPHLARIVYLSQSNQGASAARNAGLVVARGAWCAFLDGDDVWEHDFLAHQVQYALNNNLDLVWSNGIVIGDVREAGRPLLGKQPIGRCASVASLLLQEHSIVTSATLVRREHLMGVQGFDVRLRRAQDFDLWVRLVHAGARAGFNPELLMRHRVRDGNLSGGGLAQVERAAAVMRHIQTEVQLRPADEVVLQARLADLRAHQAFLEGKRFLMQRRFEEARGRFAAAADYFGFIRLRLLVWLIGIAPGLARWLYLGTSDGDIV